MLTTEESSFIEANEQMAKNAFIKCLIAIFMTIGVFGNLNVIVAIARKKILRTKNVMFILFLSIAHLFCNFSELIGLAMHFRFTPMSRRKCFNYNILYSFFILFQSSLYLIIALDMCLSIVLPFKHMLWKKSRYVLAMLIFPICFSVFCILLSLYKLSDEVVPYCVFILTPDPMVYRKISSLNVICNITTLVIIIFNISTIMIKSKNMRGSRHSTSSRSGSLKEEKHKVFRSTFFMVIIYMGSWVLATILFKIIITVKDEKETVELLRYVIIIVLPNYCQIYFVSYFRSPKLRKAFQEQLHWVTCGLLFPKVFEKPKNRVIRAANSNNNINDAKKLPEREKVLSNSPRIPR